MGGICCVGDGLRGSCSCHGERGLALGRTILGAGLMEEVDGFETARGRNLVTSSLCHTQAWALSP